MSGEEWADPEHRFDQSQFWDSEHGEWVYVAICTNAEHDPCPAEREVFRQRRFSEGEP